MNVPEQESDLVSRSYLQGVTVCIDSINNTLLEQTQALFDAILKDYIDLSILPIAPSPYLQDYMIQQASPDGVILTTYCERVQTVSILLFNQQALRFQEKTKQFLLIPRSLRLLLAISMAYGKQVALHRV